MSGMTSACACGTCPSCSGGAVRPAIADPLVYRHGAIKARMLARIASVEIDGERPLYALGTRDADDPAIALIDAFAGSLHILAYSAARLSDDGSILRTQDRDALVRLTRTLGYEPRPALSASTTLSFTVNNVAGGPTEATVPAGTKIASVPGQDEKPQTFETGAALDARAEWNALLPVMPKITVPGVIDGNSKTIVIAGTATVAKVGDSVLLYMTAQPASGTSWLYGRIVSLERAADTVEPARTTALLGQTATVTSAIAQDAVYQGRLFLFGQRAAAFGSTAPNMALVDATVKAGKVDANGEWLNLKMDAAGTTAGGTLDLDALYADAIVGRLVMFAIGTTRQAGLITASLDHSRSDFGLAAKVTQIGVSAINLDNAGPFNLKVRATAILVQTGSEALLIVDQDVELPAPQADRITIVGAAALPAGRTVVLTGEKWGAAEPTALTEVATIKSTSASGASGADTELVFERALTGRFRSTTLTLLANSVAATHGETMPNNGMEIVGSGDAVRLSPRYRLKGSPLTYVPATNARGYAPALEVRVNDRLYGEVPSLFALPPEQRVYTVHTVEDEKAELQFAGRLPTGTNNVTARYRVGSGADGNLETGRLSTIMTPVLGIMAATNPVSADGGSAAETIDDMRASAPQSIRTLDRLVSLSDFEVFARRFRGIGKALATELHVGMRKVVLLTIATTSLESPVPGSDAITSLRDAIALACVPGRKIRIEGFTDLKAQVAIAFAADPALRRADVEAAIRAAVGARFSRAARAFGEALHESAVLAAVQEVDGVVAARIAGFALPGGPAAVDGRLLCPAPMLVNGVFTRAGLLSIDADTLVFTEMAP
jgi:Baseplate J-like protein